MLDLKARAMSFIEDEEGLTILEYVIGAALIVSAIIGSGFWTTIKEKLNSIGTAVSNATA